MPWGDTTLYQGGAEDLTRGPSPNIWGASKHFQAIGDPGLGWGIFEDFVAMPSIPATLTTEIAWANHKIFCGATDDLWTMADAVGGQLVLSLPATDNVAGVFAMNAIASGSLAAYPFQISAGGLVGRLTWEARIKTSVITDTNSGIFVGLGDASVIAAAVPLNDDALEAAGDYVGFRRLEGDGDQFDAVYQAGGVTPVTMQADAALIAANTFIKLGGVFDPKDGLYRSYVNGVELAATKLVPNNTGTDFPADVRLGFMYAARSAAAAVSVHTIDWFGVFQSPS